MEQMLFPQLLITIFLAIIRLSSSQRQCSNPSSVRAGFWLSNSNRYSPLSNIDSSLYTHLYYYSLPLNKTSFNVALPTPDQLPLLTGFSAAVKSRNPPLKTLLSIATDDHQTNTSNAAFSSMADDPNLRSVFINSTIELAEAHGFDGLDLAWQFPSSASDMANLAVLLAEWRDGVNNRAQNPLSPLLLTATVYFSVHLFDGDNLDYPINAISKNLDWINAVCFSYHKSSDVTAADAALYDRTTHLSASYGIGSWLDAGIPPCKLLMGIPLYGRSWYLKNKEKNGLGAQVVAAGQREKMSNQTGIMAYFEIERTLKDANSDITYDNGMVTAYFHAGGLWITFDSLRVVEEKVRFSLRNGLLGYFLSPISFDNSNFTVSKQASDAWQRYNASGEGDNRYGKALSPEGMDPQDIAPKQSADLSSTPMVHISVLYFCLPLFLLFSLTTY